MLKYYFHNHHAFPIQYQVFAINGVSAFNDVTVSNVDKIQLWCSGPAGGRKKENIHPNKTCMCIICKSEKEIRYMHFKNYKNDNAYINELNTLKAGHAFTDTDCICKRCHDKIFYNMRKTERDTNEDMQVDSPLKKKKVMCMLAEVGKCSNVGMLTRKIPPNIICDCFDLDIKGETHNISLCREHYALAYLYYDKACAFCNIRCKRYGIKYKAFVPEEINDEIIQEYMVSNNIKCFPSEANSILCTGCHSKLFYFVKSQAQTKDIFLMKILK